MVRRTYAEKAKAEGLSPVRPASRKVEVIEQRSDPSARGCRPVDVAAKGKETATHVKPIRGVVIYRTDGGEGLADIICAKCLGRRIIDHPVASAKPLQRTFLAVADLHEPPGPTTRDMVGGSHGDPERAIDL